MQYSACLETCRVLHAGVGGLSEPGSRLRFTTPLPAMGVAVLARREARALSKYLREVALVAKVEERGNLGNAALVGYEKPLCCLDALGL